MWPCWYDECNTKLIARLPWAQFWQAIAGDVHPPLYYLVARAVGGDMVGMRAVSLACMVAAIVGLSRLTRSRSALALAALSPFVWYYAVEARPYAMMTAAVIWSVALARTHRTLSICLLTVALYTHHYAVFAIPLVALSGGGVLMPIISMILWSPGFLLLTYQIARVSQGFWLSTPAPSDLLITLYNWLVYTPTGVWAVVGLAVTIGVVIFVARYSKTIRPEIAQGVWAFTILPFLVSWLVTPVYLARYTIAGAMFGYAAIGEAIDAAPRGRAVLGMLLAAMMAGNVFGVARLEKLSRYAATGGALAAELRGHTVTHASIETYSETAGNGLAFLLAQPPEAGQGAGLTPATRAALGIVEVARPSGDRFVITETPTTTPAQHAADLALLPTGSPWVARFVSQWGYTTTVYALK